MLYATRASLLRRRMATVVRMFRTRPRPVCERQPLIRRAYGVKLL